MVGRMHSQHDDVMQIKFNIFLLRCFFTTFEKNFVISPEVGYPSETSFHYYIDDTVCPKLIITLKYAIQLILTWKIVAIEMSICLLFK